ncbi:hypothetical protein RFI_18570, partial [Reticulomyxa filosa]
VFLDGLFYPENPDLKSNLAVLKAKRFFNSCMWSTSSEEQLRASTLLRELVAKVNFTDARNKSKGWDSSSSLKFQEALAWLGARSWNYLFSLTAVGEQTTYFRENYKYWLLYSSQNWSMMLNNTVVPLYQDLFGLSTFESNQLADDVLDFASSVYAISTNDHSYLDPTRRQSYLRYTTNISIFGTSSVLNYTSLSFFMFVYIYIYF